MLRHLTFGLLAALSIVKGIAAVDCGYGYSYYYCSPGQSCGSFYGDCRGLPIYATMGIISVSIFILSFCIRFCIHINTSPQQVASTSVNARAAQGPVRSLRNNNNTRAPTAVPVHLFREDAPPSYAVATDPAANQTKY